MKKLIAGLICSFLFLGLPTQANNLELVPLGNGMELIIDPSADGVNKNVDGSGLWRVFDAQGRLGSARGIHNYGEAQAVSTIYVDEFYQADKNSWGYRPFNFCETFLEPHCSTEQRAIAGSDRPAKIRIQGIFGQDICTTEQDFYCIEEVTKVNDATGERTALVFNEPIGVDSQALPSQGIPRGVRGLLFSDPTNPSITYSVLGSAHGWWINGELSFNRYKLSITPTKVLTGNYVPASKPFLSRSVNSDFVSPTRYAQSHDECAWIQTGRCGMQAPFEEDSSFEVKLRLPKELGGWFIGRIHAPTLEELPTGSPRINRVKITGKSALVPSLFLFCDAECLIQRGYEPSRVGGYSTGESTGRFDFLMFSSRRENSIPDSQMATLRSTGYNSLWQVNLVNHQIDYGKCQEYKTAITGISGSDALFMQATPPERVGNQLEFRIASTHFDHKGKVDYGSYSAYVDAAFLGCQTGSTNIPTAATVSVIASETGEIVSTQTVGAVGKWLKLEATNITFSEKKIRLSVGGGVLGQVTGFKAAASKLTSSQRSQISKIARKLSRGSISCAGTYNQAKDRTVALARAKAVCSAAKSQNRNLKISSKVQQVGPQEAGKVVVNQVS